MIQIYRFIIFGVNTNLYNNRRIVMAIWAPGIPMRARDRSLELSRRTNDQCMNLFWFARAARPQRAKMCFFTT